MKKQSILFFLTILFLNSIRTFGQVGNYWQQSVDYKMEINVNIKQNKYSGTQELIYINNSPDNLQKVFYHLYFNAFQPNSEMDIRLQNVIDPDTRMVNNLGTKKNPIYQSRISKLSPDEIGFIKIKSLKQNNEVVEYEVSGTILEVSLNESIKSGDTAIFTMNFEVQIPIQIRRSGRDNADGIALSMTQWYPKMAEYDFEGWHATPYIGREFHGVWGNFDVTINIDRNYTIGGTGVLQNPQAIGHGYEDKTRAVNISRSKNLSWHFIAKNVHDFAWAADPDYIHDIVKMKDGPDLHFFYKGNKDVVKNWKELQPYAEKSMQFFSANIGAYPWKQYSIIQGGDGGMEYAMCTLITGGANFKGLKSTTYHEMAHTWFQQILATNEGKYAWMDEGFTSYISGFANYSISGEKNKHPHKGSYGGYYYIVKEKLEEPLSTHADRFNTNVAYGVASYVKGKMFLSQLEYIIGSENVVKTIKEYYNQWKMKHPTPNDFKRIAEKISGIQLDWYLNEWIQTTHTIDYGVDNVAEKKITIERIGTMPMPIDLEVIYENGKIENFYIPLQMMRGEKPTTATILKDWAWAVPTYTFKVSSKIKSVKIDNSHLMADINRDNNVYIKE